jgi:hypothetical protein
VCRRMLGWRWRTYIIWYGHERLPLWFVLFFFPSW